MKTAPLPPLVLATALLMSAGLLNGCASTPGEVDKKQLAQIRADAARIQPGTPRDQALASFKGANTVRLSSALLDGVSIEEWKVEAFDETDSGRDLFVAFLYFANGTLVDQSDHRIDYRANDNLRKNWGASAGGK